MTQPQLFAVARTTDPSTSWAAAASVRNIRRSQTEVLALITEPLTDEEIQKKAAAAGVKQSVSGLRTRRSELVDLGLVEDSGLRATTKAGRQSVRWQRT